MLTKNESLTELAQQRAVGHGAIQVEWRHGRSRIARLFQEGCAKIRMPRVTRDPFEAILINTAGGLTGGDRMNWTLRACEGTSAVITTQACERIYRSPESAAVIETRLTAEKGTHLAWLPQETILFDRSALSRRLDVDMDGSATVLLVEAVVFGRQAMGEIVTEARFHDRWRVSVDGRPIHAEDFRLGPDLGAQLARAAIAGGQRALATVLLVGPDAGRHLDEARAITGDDGAVSTWQSGGINKLLARLHAPDSYSLRKRLAPLLRLLNGQSLPKVWSI
ncbi:MAG TPA: urease accessory protein UreD [Mesorhizobium sp.]|jgi:urease accessory protein|uniref:urease accessory protein UreD n=1 Tax=Mesorhizobium sp. TaxID=1871066 RepID=UPI002DDD3DD4|nr:urease accessory protein UreD [Mesorhizobium sp.]HEV2507187.1 urease accessory protein UreD [Mesorhizobium sp.]